MAVLQFHMNELHSEFLPLGPSNLRQGDVQRVLVPRHVNQ